MQNLLSASGTDRAKSWGNRTDGASGIVPPFLEPGLWGSWLGRWWPLDWTIFIIRSTGWERLRRWEGPYFLELCPHPKCTTKSQEVFKKHKNPSGLLSHPINWHIDSRAFPWYLPIPGVIPFPPYAPTGPSLLVDDHILFVFHNLI